MSSEKPWWFSGDEPEGAQPDAGGPAERKQPASEQPASTPEWPEPEQTRPEQTRPEQTGRSGPGIADVIAGVGTLVSWARERVIDPHLEHENPAEHPDCVICRGMTAVSRLSDLAPVDIDIDLDDDDQLGIELPDETADDITWVPLTRRGARRGKARS